jgi:ferric-dicitrate binding protein FerR (iron transport regulator)
VASAGEAVMRLAMYEEMTVGIIQNRLDKRRISAKYDFR